MVPLRKVPLPFVPLTIVDFRFLVVTALSSVCTKFNLYDNDVVLVCLGKSSFVKSFINSIVIVRFFVSPADKISPSLTSFPF